MAEPDQRALRRLALYEAYRRLALERRAAARDRREQKLLAQVQPAHDWLRSWIQGEGHRP